MVTAMGVRLPARRGLHGQGNAARAGGGNEVNLGGS